MKKLIITLLGCWLAGSVSGQKNCFQTNAAISTFMMPERRTKPLILAHRGGPDAGDTENSLKTFSKAINDVPDAILEMDVRMTKDSVLTLLHDDELERTTTGTGSLKAQTWQALSRLQLRDLTGKPTAQKMPLFEDVLRWNRNRAVLALDIKPGVDLRKVMCDGGKTQGPEQRVCDLLYRRKCRCIAAGVSGPLAGAGRYNGRRSGQV